MIASGHRVSRVTDSHFVTKYLPTACRLLPTDLNLAQIRLQIIAYISQA